MTGQLSDAELLIASCADPAAFAELYERSSWSILGYFYRRTWDPHVSANLVADTCAAAWLRRGTYRELDGSPNAWLFGITRRELGATGAVAGSSSVLSSVSASKSHTWGNDSIERIEEMVDAQAFREELEAALKRLSASERGAVQFRLMRQVCPWSGHVSPNKTCSRPPRPSRSVVWREGFTVSSRSATHSAAEQRDVFESYQDPCTG